MPQILIVEDDLTVREWVKDVLESQGFQVETAINGRDGLKVAQSLLPDLILCDVNMPGLDGYGVLQELRNNSSTKTTPLIFLTAQSERADMRQGMELGADDYLTKPFKVVELLAAIEVQLKKQAGYTEKYEAVVRQVRKNIVYALPHELRTPLTSIIGYAQLLKFDYQTAQPDEIMEYAEYIIRGADRLQRLVENYLVYAQIEIMAGDPEVLAGLRDSALEYPGDIIFDEAQRTLQQAQSRSDDLKLELCNCVLAIAEKDFRKVVFEVIANALKFSDAGSPVWIRSVVEDNTFVLCISDSGRGMTPEQIQSVGAFMQFGRALHEQQGVGLGLVIARRLVELYQGSMEIISKPSEGTTITIRLQCVH